MYIFVTEIDITKGFGTVVLFLYSGVLLFSVLLIMIFLCAELLFFKGNNVIIYLSRYEL